MNDITSHIGCSSRFVYIRDDIFVTFFSGRRTRHLHRSVQWRAKRIFGVAQASSLHRPYTALFSGEPRGFVTALPRTHGKPSAYVLLAPASTVHKRPNTPANYLILKNLLDAPTANLLDIAAARVRGRSLAVHRGNMAQSAAKSTRARSKDSRPKRKVVRKGRKAAPKLKPSSKKTPAKKPSAKRKNRLSGKPAARSAKKKATAKKAKSQSRPQKSKSAAKSKRIARKPKKAPRKPVKITRKVKPSAKHPKVSRTKAKTRLPKRPRPAKKAPARKAKAAPARKKTKKVAPTRSIKAEKTRLAKRVVKKLPPKIIRAPIVPLIVAPQVDKKAITEAQRAAVAAQKRAKAALREYEQSLKLFYRHEYADAKKGFEAILAEYGREVEMARRIHDYIRVCDQRLETKRSAPRDLEGLYNAGVFALNAGNYDRALQLLERAEKIEPKTDHVLYSLAAALAQKGEADLALEKLRAAVAINPAGYHHVHARRDPDFASLQENEAFRQLVGYDYESESGEE